jgi:hypothetical protein
MVSGSAPELIHNSLFENDCREGCWDRQQGKLIA